MASAGKGFKICWSRPQLACHCLCFQMRDLVWQRKYSHLSHVNQLLIHVMFWCELWWVLNFRDAGLSTSTGFSALPLQTHRQVVHQGQVEEGLYGEGIAMSHTLGHCFRIRRRVGCICSALPHHHLTRWGWVCFIGECLMNQACKVWEECICSISDLDHFIKDRRW